MQLQLPIQGTHTQPGRNGSSELAGRLLEMQNQYNTAETAYRHQEMLSEDNQTKKHNFQSTMSANQSFIALDDQSQKPQNEELQSLREVRCSRSNNSRSSKNGT